MVNPKKLPFKEFKYIYKKVPRLCVDLIIKTQKGIVLVKRDIPPDKGKWHFPGGTILLGEKLSEAIKRVAKEETGLGVKIRRIIDVMEFSREGIHGHAHVISIAFLVEPKSGKLRGSIQGRKIKFFKSIPENIIVEQEKFLIKNYLLK